MPLRPLHWLAVLGVLLTGGAHALPPPICAPGRFVVQGSPLLGFGDPGSDAVSYDATQIWTDTGCAPVVAQKLRATKRGTKVRAVWPTGCGIYTGRIVLSATVDFATCETMTGTFKFRGTDGRKVKRGFTATRFVDGSCDDGGVEAFPLIQSRIFYGRGCNVATCHGANAPRAGLDLSQQSAYLNLVGVPAALPGAAGKTRVVAGDADASFLVHKLEGTLGAGEGSRMPLIGPALPAEELALVRAWIDAGAPQSGRVPDQPCLPPNEYVPTPAPPPPPGGFQLLLEGPWLQPGQEQEGCMWIPTPNATSFVAGKWEFALNPGTHHFAIFDWDKTGTPQTGVWRPGDVGCISGADFGQSIAGAPQAPYFTQTYPTGIGRLLPAGHYLGLNAHYRNYWEVPIQIRVWINIHPFQGTPEHLAETIVDFTDMFSISVPPGTQRIQPGRWQNLSGRPLHVFSVSGHMHQRGLRFTARSSSGTTIYENFDFAHPIFREFVPPLVLNHGDWIDYECLHDNGVTKPVRRDSAGNPTTLVFGTTTEDEMCTLNGEFYTD